MAVPWAEAADECVQLLSRLLRFDTTNPPGNETACAQWIRETLAREGIAVEVLEPEPGRGSVVARIPAARRQAPDAGTPTGPGVPTEGRSAGHLGSGPLLLMSHTDVVPALAEEWTHHPFSGAIADGQVWGRGALDMKNTVATWMSILLWLRRTGLELARDLIFIATADEEAGGRLGAGWLAEHHWDLVACAAALNEGGGAPIEFGGRTFYTYQTSEKAVCSFRLRARGTPGHASIPHDDNAVVHLARAVAALGGATMPVHVTPTMREFVTALAAALPPGDRHLMEAVLEPARTDAALAEAVADPYHRFTLSAQLRNAPAPTMLQAGSKINVIPSTAEAGVDLRVVPGHTPDDARAEIEAVLREAGVADHVEVEFLNRSVAYESPREGPLVDAIRRALARHAPDARLVPYLLTGGTDGRFWRLRGVPVYGFSPVLPDADHRTVHGIDERISIASLTFGLRVTWDVVADFCGAR